MNSTTKKRKIRQTKFIKKEELNTSTIRHIISDAILKVTVDPETPEIKIYIQADNSSDDVMVLHIAKSESKAMEYTNVYIGYIRNNESRIIDYVYQYMSMDRYQRFTSFRSSSSSTEYIAAIVNESNYKQVSYDLKGIINKLISCVRYECGVYIDRYHQKNNSSKVVEREVS